MKGKITKRGSKVMKMAGGGTVQPKATVNRSNDPQAKRSRSWGDVFFGNKEDNAVNSAQYKRDMGINPANNRLSNAEASRSYRSMDNPTSAPSAPKPSKPKAPSASVSKRLVPDTNFSGGPGDYSSLRKNPAAPKNPNNGIVPATPAAPKPKAKPAAPKAKAPLVTAKGKTDFGAPKTKPAAPSYGFKGNWQGAAPTEMQKRGGRRTNETPYQRMMRNAREK